MGATYTHSTPGYIIQWLPYPVNIVLVDPNNKADIAGLSYTTWEKADAYIQSLIGDDAPSATNRYAIQIGANNDENIIVRPYVNIIGIKGLTELGGQITSAGTLGGDKSKYAIWDCVIENLVVSDPNELTLQGCTIKGGTITSTANLYMIDTTVKGGDFSALASVDAIKCEFEGTYKLQGGNYKFCEFDGTVTFDTTVDYYLDNCSLKHASLSLPSGYKGYWKGVVGITALTIDSGAELNSNGLAIISVTNNGTWNNKGGNFNKAGTSLVSTDLENAIKELEGASGGGAPIPDQMIIVDPNIPEVAGRNYQSIANALTYIATQSPSATNRWGVYIGGTNNESITVPSYVMIVGTGSTRLTGSIDSAGTFTGDVFEYAVIDCIVESLDVSGINELTLTRCQIKGGTVTGGIVALLDCIVDTGDISSALVFIAVETRIESGTLPAGIYSNCDFGTVLGGTYSFSFASGSGASFMGCTFRGTASFTIASGVAYIEFQSCQTLGQVSTSGLTMLGANLSVQNSYLNFSSKIIIDNGSVCGVVNSFINSSIDIDNGGYLNVTLSGIGNVVTYNTGGTLETKIAKISSLTDGGGTWNNYGDDYDNSASGLTATEFQAVADELAGIVDQVKNIVIVDSSLPEIAGKRYQSIANALTYIATQTPSATNRWGVKVGGINSESITVPAYVSIIGEKGVTRLTGAVDSAGGFAGDLYAYVIHNCELLNVNVSGTNMLALDNCTVSGGTPTTAGGVSLLMLDCIVKGGDFSGLVGTFAAVETWFDNLSAIPASAACFDCDFAPFFAGSYTINGGSFIECSFRGTITWNGTSYLQGCSFFAMVSMTIPNGATVALYNCNGIGLTITVNSGGTMGITGCSGIYINDNGGTINDYGVAIQNNLIKNDSGYVNDSVSAIKVLAGDGNQIDLNTTGTASPVTINSVTLDDESAYHIKARVVAKKQDGSDRALYTFEGLFYRDGGGNATQEGSTTTISTIESAGMSGCACDFAVSGSQVFVQVTGLDATSIDWRTQIEIAKV